MPCKHLVTKLVQPPREIGGTPLPQPPEKWPSCRLVRQPNEMGWASKCKATPSDGPCWLWIEEHGKQPDPDF
jgi:hypothetical protein